MKKIPCEIWSRVTGYYRPVQNYNPGKQEEFKDRKKFKIGANPDDKQRKNFLACGG